MREIKFRGKRVDNGEWAYWNEFGETTEPFLCKTGAYGYIAKRDIVPATVGQFTGLRDELGREIYSGDIIQGIERGEFGTALSKWRAMVEWQEDRCMFIAKDIDGVEDLSLWEYDFDNVIGNAYDNPELLKEK